MRFLCLASINLAAVQLVAQSLSITALSSTSPTALTPLYISTTGIDSSGDPVTVKFSNDAGFLFTEKALRIGSDGSVVAAVPIYIDPVSQATTSGSVFVTLTQGSQSTAPVAVNIQDIPALSSYGTKLGQISHAFLVYGAMLTSLRINELQAYQVLPRNTVDTLQSQKSLQTLLLALIKARSDVDAVSTNSTLVINGPKLSGSQTLVFDKNALDLMDRSIGLTLTAAAPVILSAITNPKPQLKRIRFSAPSLDWPMSATGHLPTAFTRPDKLPSATDTSVATIGSVMAILTGVENQISLASAYSDYYANDSTAIDKSLAVAGGLGSLYSSATLSATGAVKKAGDYYGAAVTAAALLHNLGMELGDLGFLMVASNHGWAQPVAAEAWDDLQKNAHSAWDNTRNLEISLLSFKSEAAGGVAALMSTVYDCVTKDCYYSINDTSLQAGAETTMQFPDSTQGFATVAGTINIPDYASGITNLPPPSGVNAASEISLSSTGVLFNNMPDANGNYNFFIPLHGDPFAYASANLQIIDPVTQNIVNIIDPTSGKSVKSLNIDLSGLSSDTPFQIPTIRAFVDCYKMDTDCSKQCDAVYPDPFSSPQRASQWSDCNQACYSAWKKCDAAPK